MSKDTLSGDIAIEERAVGAVDRLLDTSRTPLHSRAAFEFFRDNNDILVRLFDWIRHRFEALMIESKDEVTLKVNPLNETMGIGLQMVTFSVKRPRRFRHWLDPEDRLLSGEAHHPSIVIVSSGLLDGSPQSCLVNFPGKPGRVQIITPLSPDLFMGVREAQIKEAGQFFVVPFPEPFSLVAQRNKPPFSELREGIENNGVFVREVLKETNS